MLFCTINNKKNILKIVAIKFVDTDKTTLFLQRKQNYKQYATSQYTYRK